MTLLLAFCKYIFIEGRNLRWQGAGAVATMLAMFVWALIATYGERTGLREAFVSLIMALMFVVLGTLVWGKVHHAMGWPPPGITPAERKMIDRMENLRGPYTLRTYIDFFNVIGWLAVPLTVVTLIWHGWGLMT